MKRALLLVGSPKPSGSASETIGTYLMQQLASRGFETATAHLHRSVRSPGSLDELGCLVDDCDVIVLAAPLYVDSLPAPVIRAFEVLAARRGPSDAHTKPRLLAIVNSGFPESFQSDTAIAICRLFARDAQFDWAGGFRVGGGGVVGSKALAEARGPAKRLAQGLALAAAALASGLPVPKEAFDLADRPMMPIRLYAFVGDLSMRWEAYRKGVYSRIKDRPYAP
ncbi:MAG: NAD(P)H-dependent oxidoreductase [Bacteroidales bacterium]